MISDRGYDGYDPTAVGCSNCGSPETVTCDGFHGRRCANCPPAFDPDVAVELHVAGFPGAALAYLRSAQEDVA